MNVKANVERPVALLVLQRWSQARAQPRGRDLCLRRIERLMPVRVVDAASYNSA